MSFIYQFFQMLYLLSKFKVFVKKNRGRHIISPSFKANIEQFFVIFGCELQLFKRQFPDL